MEYIKNIFLTGDINVGKSTIINQYIEQTKDYYKALAGFKTKELFVDECLKGYYLEDQLFHNKDFTLIGKNILFPSDKKCQGITQAFETRGVEILQRALESKADLVIMDELGFFEREAKMFQKKVFQLLNSEKRVLGVVKKKSNPFLDNIKEKDNVKVLEVSIPNRSKIINQINEIWRIEK